MTALLDTHFLIWLLLGSPRLREFPWIDRYLPWGVSPVSFLEMQYLAEVGKLQIVAPVLVERIAADRRFLVDEAPLLSLMRSAMNLGWTRDPFDRLLAAHSTVRRVPLCTVDRTMRDHHRLLTPELAK